MLGQRLPSPGVSQGSQWLHWHTCGQQYCKGHIIVVGQELQSCKWYYEVLIMYIGHLRCTGQEELFSLLINRRTIGGYYQGAFLQLLPGDVIIWLLREMNPLQKGAGSVSRCSHCCIVYERAKRSKITSSSSLSALGVILVNNTLTKESSSGLKTRCLNGTKPKNNSTAGSSQRELHWMEIPSLETKWWLCSRYRLTSTISIPFPNILTCIQHLKPRT